MCEYGSTKVLVLWNNSGFGDAVPSGLCAILVLPWLPAQCLAFRMGLMDVCGTEFRNTDLAVRPLLKHQSPLVSKHYGGKVRGARPSHVFLASSLIKL